MLGVDSMSTKSAEEIYAELAQSRDSYEHGDVIDFDSALDAIDKKYGLYSCN